MDHLKRGGKNKIVLKKRFGEVAFHMLRAILRMETFPLFSEEKFGKVTDQIFLILVAAA
jgi:hypothetical protein